MRDIFLDIIQKNFPLSERPFKSIGEILGITEEESINLYQSLKEEGIIRQTSAILESKKIGYLSTLVAFRVKDIEKASIIINNHPGVSHNYERDNKDFNLWFTLTLPHDSLFGIEKTVEVLAKLSKAEEYLILPTLKMFKIGVKLDIAGKNAKKEKLEKKISKEIEINPIHHRIMYYLQEDLKVEPFPFENIIRELSISYKELFSLINDLIEGGYIRRYASILNHRKAGFMANAMVVWNIQEEKEIEIGEKIASYSAVSHCYIRKRYPNWNYNIYLEL